MRSSSLPRARRRLTKAAARRIAITAQGLGEPRPKSVTRRQLRNAAGRLGAVQIDSVNVLARSHYLPFWSRLGAYSRPLLKTGIERHRDMFEYWGHAASFLPVELQPLLRWRMERAAASAWPALTRFERERPGYVDAVLAEVRARGPLAASDLTDGGAATGPWWGWGDGKIALEWLFWTGQLTSAGRRASFERLYDLPERVFPPAVLSTPTPALADAHRELVHRATRALGVARIKHVADYFRLPLQDVRPRVAELVEAGALELVTVDDGADPWVLDSGARRPRAVTACALLSPFDSMVWERKRVEELFGMRYRIELYTPAPKRVHGYYVLPFLLGEQLVARVDLKADRAAGVLQVPAVWPEPGADAKAVCAALAGELRTMAAWLELDTVAVGDRGELAKPLARALRG